MTATEQTSEVEKTLTERLDLESNFHSRKALGHVVQARCSGQWLDTVIGEGLVLSCLTEAAAEALEQGDRWMSGGGRHLRIVRNKKA